MKRRLAIVLVLCALILAGLLLLAGGTVPAIQVKIIDETGTPVAGAEVALVGHVGSVKTDGDGQFIWRGDIRPPLVVLIVLPGGRVAKPIQVAAFDPSAVTTLQVQSVLTEDVTVAAGDSFESEAGLCAWAGTVRRSASAIGPAKSSTALRRLPGIEITPNGTYCCMPNGMDRPNLKRPPSASRARSGSFGTSLRFGHQCLQLSPEMRALHQQEHGDSTRRSSGLRTPAPAV